MPTPISALPGALHDRPHVGEVEVDQAGPRDQIADALHALAQHVVGDAEGVEHRGAAVEHLQQALVRDDDDRVDLGREALEAEVGRRLAARALEPERHRDDGDRERTELAREPRHDGRRAAAGATTLADRDEDHVGAAQRLAQAIAARLGDAPAELVVAARAEPARLLAAERDLDASRRTSRAAARPC